MVRLGLNRRKPDNYAFFCPVSRLHLTMGNPSGKVDEITPAILRGLKTGILLDIDGVVDLATGKVAEQPKEPKNANNNATGIPAKEPEPQEQKEETKKKAASRRKQNKETE